MLQSLCYCECVSPCGCYLGRFVRTDACVSAPNKQVQGRGSHKLAAGHWAGESTNILLTMCPGGSRSTVGTLVNTAGIKLDVRAARYGGMSHSRGVEPGSFFLINVVFLNYQINLLLRSSIRAVNGTSRSFTVA